MLYCFMLKEHCTGYTVYCIITYIVDSIKLYCASKYYKQKNQINIFPVNSPNDSFNIVIYSNSINKWCFAGRSFICCFLWTRDKHGKFPVSEIYIYGMT